MMTTKSEAMTAIDRAFGSISRPDHFTNYVHCEECAEHDELLRARTRETLAIQDVGNPGWDPMCFSSPEGIAFYMPSLVRLAFAEPLGGYGWYGDQLLFHLYSGGTENGLYKYCNAEQRLAIAVLLSAMIECRAADIKSISSVDEFFRAYEIWSHEKR